MSFEQSILNAYRIKGEEALINKQNEETRRHFSTQPINLSTVEAIDDINAPDELVGPIISRADCEQAIRELKIAEEELQSLQDMLTNQQETNNDVTKLIRDLESENQKLVQVAQDIAVNQEIERIQNNIDKLRQQCAMLTYHRQQYLEFDELSKEREVKQKQIDQIEQIRVKQIRIAQLRSIIDQYKIQNPEITIEQQHNNVLDRYRLLVEDINKLYIECRDITEQNAQDTEEYQNALRELQNLSQHNQYKKQIYRAGKRQWEWMSVVGVGVGVAIAIAMQEEKYNLVIIGGGPAAVQFLFNLLRTSKLPEYLGGLGIAIIEKNKSFGAGNYESKLTYSNQPAKDILRLMYFHQTDQMMGLCKELVETHAYKTLLQYGDKYPPKSLVGYFLRLMGNTLLKHIYTIKKQLIFKPNKEAISLRLLADGWFQLRTQTLDAPIKDKYKSIKSKCILLCTGRQQSQADLFCQEKGFIQQLIYQPSIINGSGQRAMECAELLLNGPIMYINQEIMNPITLKIYTCPVCKSTKCSCFGSLVPIKYAWHTTDVVLPEFQKGQLRIQSAFQIVPQFDSKDNDYLTIPASQLGPKGHANYLSGLRGKARALFLKILAGQENRVRLSKEDILMDVDASVSRACEVETRDPEGNIIIFQKTLNVLQLDHKNRVKTDRGSIRNMYAYGSCCITVSQQELSNERELTEQLECTLGFEDCGIMYLNERNDQMMPWFDNNEFPVTAQSHSLSKGDFDSDQSVHSEIVETECVALNNLQEQLKRRKK